MKRYWRESWPAWLGVPFAIAMWPFGWDPPLWATILQTAVTAGVYVWLFRRGRRLRREHKEFKQQIAAHQQEIDRITFHWRRSQKAPLN